MIDILELVLGWIHIVSVLVWIGGALFLDVVVLPSIKDVPGSVANMLSKTIHQRFTPMARLAAILVAVTGLFRAYYLDSFNTSILFNTQYGYILLAKIIIFTIMFGLGMSINYIGVKLAKSTDVEYVNTAQKRIKLLSESIVVLGITVIFLAVALSLSH